MMEGSGGNVDETMGENGKGSGYNEEGRVRDTLYVRSVPIAAAPALRIPRCYHPREGFFLVAI